MIFLLQDNYIRKWRRVMQKRAPERTQFLLTTGQAFGPNLVAASSDLDSIDRCFEAIFNKCSGRFWALRPESVPSQVIHSPPAEMFTTITLDKFREEYRHPRQWLLTATAGDTFHHVEGFSVQRDGATYRMSRNDLLEPDASRWQRSVPPPGTQMTSRRYGRCSLVKTYTRPDMNTVYSLVVSTWRRRR